MDGMVCQRCGGQAGPAPYAGAPSYPAPAYNQPAYGQPAYGQPAYGQSAYGVPPPAYSPYPPPIPYAPQGSAGFGWQSILGILCGIGGIIMGILSIFFCAWLGFVFGALAIGLGQAANKENQSGATAAIGLGVGAFVVTIAMWVIFAALILSSF